MTALLVQTEAPQTGGWTQYGRMWRRRFPGGLIGRVYQLPNRWLWTLWCNGTDEIEHLQRADSWEQAAEACEVYAFAYHDHHGETNE